LVVDVRDVITWFKFGGDRLRGLGSAEGQILPFPIDFDGRPYNTLTLPSERVKVYLLSICRRFLVHVVQHDVDKSTANRCNWSVGLTCVRQEIAVNRALKGEVGENGFHSADDTETGEDNHGHVNSHVLQRASPPPPPPPGVASSDSDPPTQQQVNQSIKTTHL